MVQFKAHKIPGIPEFAGVIFDMDGLVLDTEPTYINAWTQAALAFGAKIDADFCADLSGCHADEVEKAFAHAIGENYDKKKFLDLADATWKVQIKHQAIAKMPGFDDLLKILQDRKIPYALATNSDSYYANQCLDSAGVAECFDIIVTKDQVKHGKPAPDLFIEAAKRLNLKPENCLALEDSKTGLRAALDAKTIPILILNKKCEISQGLAIAFFYSLAEIAALIAGSY